MPYWRRPYRRYRRYWRRRPRKTFRRRRFWTRRRYWVRPRKRKLKKIILKQWQPSTIKKLKVRGQYPLFQGTSERIGNDNTAYIDEIAPQNYPAGGLYSITVFTLQGLYELHQKGRNWWTVSNCDLPLIRYLGCTLKLYYSNTVDSVNVVVNCGELKANEQMFQSCQPSVLMLNKKKKVLLCRNYKKARKPYKKWFIPPPALMLNKWYFQKEIANYPLFMILSSAASLDRYFQPADSVSSTIGFKSLNTDFFALHNWKTTFATPYHPSAEWYILGIGNRKTFDNAKREDIIMLGNTMDVGQGTTIGAVNTSTDWSNKVETYSKKKNLWGNPFDPFWFDHDPEAGLVCLLKVEQTQTVWEQIKTLQEPLKNNTGKIIQPTKPFYIDCRYNPQADMGHNATFVTRITGDNSVWHEPEDTHLVTKGLPLWLLNFGWHDYLKKSNTPQRLETDYIQVLISDYISPKMNYYVPLDWFFLNGRSPYMEEHHIKPYDQQNWHPKLNFQNQSISHIIGSGPATAKLPSLISVEGHFTYNFHFKVGGCPPDMDKVCEPSKQPQYPQPGNILSSILLQNPSTPIQYYLSSFDQRRDYITKKASKRLKEDAEFKETVFKPTGKTLLDLQLPSPTTTSEEDSSSEEESEEAVQQHLHRHQRKQRKLQHGILKLLTLLESK
nr:MAG: ORF1 [TTV-like mini virus]